MGWRIKIWIQTSSIFFQTVSIKYWIFYSSCLIIFTISSVHCSACPTGKFNWLFGGGGFPWVQETTSNIQKYNNWKTYRLPCDHFLVNVWENLCVWQKSFGVSESLSVFFQPCFPSKRLLNKIPKMISVTTLSHEVASRSRNISFLLLPDKLDILVRCVNASR